MLGIHVYGYIGPALGYENQTQGQWISPSSTEGFMNIAIMHLVCLKHI